MLPTMRELNSKRLLTRKRILDAAMKVFSKHGYHEATIAEIARESEVSEGTIYLYFINKDDLIIEVAGKAVNEIFDRIQAATAKVSNPLEKLFVFMEANAEEFFKNPELTRVVVIELHKTRAFTGTSSGFNFEPYNKYMEFITAICEEAIDAGLVRKIPAADLAHTIFACLDYPFRIWALYNFQPNVQQLVARMKNIITYGIIK
jgi:TetR/AcrR family transcriptional regulator, fatty acid metabolism regulator protein